MNMSGALQWGAGRGFLAIVVMTVCAVLLEESLSSRQLYQVLGNSLNVYVVSVLVHLLHT